MNVSVAVKEAPGASQSGAPVDRTNGLPAGKAHDVAPVALVRVAPDVRLSTAISNGAPMACEEVFLTVIDWVYVLFGPAFRVPVSTLTSDDTSVPQRRPYTLTPFVCVDTYTFPFATTGGANLVKSPSASRALFMSLL